MKKLLIVAFVFMFAVVDAQSLSPPSDLSTDFTIANITFAGTDQPTILNLFETQIKVGQTFTYSAITISEPTVRSPQVQSLGRRYVNETKIYNPEIPPLYRDIYLRQDIEQRE